MFMTQTPAFSRSCIFSRPLETSRTVGPCMVERRYGRSWL